MFKQKYYVGSYIVSVLGILAAAFLGWYYDARMENVLNFVFMAVALAVLEISISFDNAVVNASTMKRMSPVWQARFMTWGMLIAVFGMRLIFPLAIVSVAAQVDPWAALKLAALEPNRYAEIMIGVEHEVAAFGGTFLLLVSLEYFFDYNKDLHWIHFLEAPMARFGKIRFIVPGLGLVALLSLAQVVPGSERKAVLVSGIFGIAIFLAIEALGHWLEKRAVASTDDIHKAGLGLFIYLEVLDASFSFDGVIGAFAITNNLFLIVIGLGIGAMFVRSLTLAMVKERVTETLIYLEHGAFWAVVSLAAIMYLNTMIHIPEYITAGLGIGIIGLSLHSSMRAKKLASS